MASPKKRVSKSKTKIRKNIWKKKANTLNLKVFSKISDIERNLKFFSETSDIKRNLKVLKKILDSERNLKLFSETSDIERKIPNFKRKKRGFQ